MLVKRSPEQAAIGWFLTYPKCPLSKEEVLRLLQAQDNPVVQWVIATEKHQDGTLHVHAFIKYHSKVTFGAHRWDLIAPDKIYHGNYQAARSWSAVSQYCQKGGDFIASFDTAAAAGKRAARNQHLLEGDLQELVTSGFLPLTQLKSVYMARNLFAQLTAPLTRPEVCGIWIYGPPGIGKSHYVRTKESDLFIKAQNKWFDGYTNQTAILLDDFDHQGVCLFHYLKIWADKWPCSGEVKGDTVALRHERFYVTSNFRIEDLFSAMPYDTIRAIRRRFKVLHMMGLDRPNKPQSPPAESVDC